MLITLSFHSRQASNNSRLVGPQFFVFNFKNCISGTSNKETFAQSNAMHRSPATALLKTIVCVAGKTRGGLKMNERNQAVHSTTSRWECYNSTTMWHIEQPGGTQHKLAVCSTTRHKQRVRVLYQHDQAVHSTSSRQYKQPQLPTDTCQSTIHKISGFTGQSETTLAQLQGYMSFQHCSRGWAQKSLRSHSSERWSLFWAYICTLKVHFNRKIFIFKKVKHF